MRKISFYNPVFRGNESVYVNEALDSGWVSSTGEFIGRFEGGFTTVVGNSSSDCFGVPVNSGTSALILALRSLGIGVGDEVIVPSMTFAATVHAVLVVGAIPVIVDVDLFNWCISSELCERFITKKTRAIITVHLFGGIGDLWELRQLCLSKGISLIEDSAEALGSKIGGRHVGTIGDIGCFSFYGNKTITTGEGGMVVTGDSSVAERVRWLSSHAMSTGSGLYWHEDVGYNFRMTNLQAALGLAQLEQLDNILLAKMRLFQRYRSRLDSRVTFQCLDMDVNSSYWVTPILFETEECLMRVISALKGNNIEFRRFFVPLENLPHLSHFCASKCTNSKELFSRGLMLPSDPNLSDFDIDAVSEVILDELS